jgi:hypothetical protein
VTAAEFSDTVDEYGNRVHYPKENIMTAPTITRTPADKKERKVVPALSEVLGNTALHSKPIKPGTDTPKNPMRKGRVDKAPRDRFQRQLDHDAEVVYNQWLNAGKPTSFKDSPRVRYEIPENAVEPLLKACRRTVGTGGPESVRGKTFRYRPGTVAETGLSVIEWFICDVQPKPDAA